MVSKARHRRRSGSRRAIQDPHLHRDDGERRPRHRRQVILPWWSSVGTIQRQPGVVDLKGNPYARAGPTIQSGVATQAIYYAKNIQAAAIGNTVTVTFAGREISDIPSRDTAAWIRSTL